MADAAEKLDAGFAAVLEKTKTEKKPAKKKKTAPELDVPENVKEAVDEFVNAKVTKKKAEAAMKAAEPVVLEHVKEVQDNDGFNGEFRKSYDVPGKTERVKFVSSNRYTVNPDDVPEIKELIGDGADEMIEVEYDVRLRPEVLKDPDLQKELMTLLKGGELFEKFFYTNKEVKVADDFDGKIYKKLDADALAMLRVLMKQYKPSLR